MNILANMLEPSVFSVPLGKYFPEKDFQTITQITLITAQLCFSLFFEECFRDHVSLREPLQALVISTTRFVANVLVALPAAPLSIIKSDPEFLLGLSKFLATAHSHLGPCSVCELEEGNGYNYPPNI